MPLPSPTGWAPEQYLNTVLGGGDQNVAQPTQAPIYDYSNVDIASDTVPPGVNAMAWRTWSPSQRQQWLDTARWSNWARENPDEYLASLQPDNGFLGDVLGGVGNVINSTVRPIGEFVNENPALLFAAPFIAAAATGALGGAGAAGGGAGGGGAGAGTTSATTFPYTAGGTITGSAIPGVTSATTAANAAAAGIGPIAGAGAAGAAGAAGSAGGAAGPAAGGAVNALSNVPDWVGNYLIPGLNTLLGANAADQSSDAMVAAADRALEENRRQFDLTRSDLAPWLTEGQRSLGNLRDPNAFTASPGYEWSRKEGVRDIGNSFAARGGAASGNALRALSEFQTGLAQQDYNNWWNREAGIAGVGQNTAVNLGGIGANAAADRGNFLTNAGNARASGVLGRNAAIAGGVNDSLYNHLYRRRA